jgi:hypothetical protein
VSGDGDLPVGLTCYKRTFKTRGNAVTKITGLSHIYPMERGFGLIWWAAKDLRWMPV